MSGCIQFPGSKKKQKFFPTLILLLWEFECVTSGIVKPCDFSFFLQHSGTKTVIFQIELGMEAPVIPQFLFYLVEFKAGRGRGH